MPDESEKTPASSMIRVPTPLIAVVKELARLHREGYTDSIVEALEALVETLDSNASKQNFDDLASKNKHNQQADSSLDAAPDINETIAIILQRLDSLEAMIAASQASKIRNSIRPLASVLEHDCPYCSSNDLMVWGKDKTKPRYKCRGCERVFTPSGTANLASGQ